MKNSILKKILVFILIVALSFLLFFGLGDLEKTTKPIAIATKTQGKIFLLKERNKNLINVT